MGRLTEKSSGARGTCRGEENSEGVLRSKAARRPGSSQTWRSGPPDSAGNVAVLPSLTEDRHPAWL